MVEFLLLRYRPGQRCCPLFHDGYIHSSIIVQPNDQISQAVVAPDIDIISGATTEEISTDAMRKND